MINIDVVRYVIVDMKPGPQQYWVRSSYWRIPWVPWEGSHWPRPGLSEKREDAQRQMKEDKLDPNRYEIKSVVLTLELQSGRS